MAKGAESMLGMAFDVFDSSHLHGNSFIYSLYIVNAFNISILLFLFTSYAS